MNANSQLAQRNLNALAAKINSANNRMRTKFRDWILEVDGYLQEAKSQLKGADFLQWCETQLLWKKSRVYQIMDSAKVVQTLVDADMSGDFLPQSESWCRQLQRLPDELPEHWSHYLEQYADDQRTAATVKQYVDEVMGPKTVKGGDDVPAIQGEVRRGSLLDGSGIIHASSHAQSAILHIYLTLVKQHFWTRDESNEGIDCQRERDYLADAYELAAKAIRHNEPLEPLLDQIKKVGDLCSHRTYQPPTAVTVDAVDVAPAGVKVTKTIKPGQSNGEFLGELLEGKPKAAKKKATKKEAAPQTVSKELDIPDPVKPHEVQPIKVAKFLKSLQWNVPYYQDVFKKREMPQLIAWSHTLTARGFEKTQMYGCEIVEEFYEHVGAAEFYEIDDDKDTKRRTAELIDTLAKYFRSRRWKEKVEQSKEPASEVAS